MSIFDNDEYELIAATADVSDVMFVVGSPQIGWAVAHDEKGNTHDETLYGLTLLFKHVSDLNDDDAAPFTQIFLLRPSQIETIRQILNDLTDPLGELEV